MKSENSLSNKPASVNPVVAVNSSRGIFLPSLGVPSDQRMNSPTKNTYPSAFNYQAKRLWEKSLPDTSLGSPAEDWDYAITTFLALCAKEGVFAFSNSFSQSQNDAIMTHLASKRRDLVKFFNRTEMLTKTRIRKVTSRAIVASEGLFIVVTAPVSLRDPSFGKWILQTPMPRFDVVREGSRWRKNISSDCDLYVYNEGANMSQRWFIEYQIQSRILPSIPGNRTPSKRDLEYFALNTIWNPILKSHRPDGMMHRLV